MNQTIANWFGVIGGILLASCIILSLILLVMILTAHIRKRARLTLLTIWAYIVTRRRREGRTRISGTRT